MAKRDKYPTRNIRLIGEVQVETAVRAVQLAPVDRDHPIEVVIREMVRARSSSANARYWAVLHEIAEQGYVNCRTFSAETWHEHCRREFLPEDTDPEISLLVADPEKYRKWGYLPSGDRIIVGSTTDLTVRGFAEYLEQVYAMGAELGVLFHEG